MNNALIRGSGAVLAAVVFGGLAGCSSSGGGGALDPNDPDAMCSNMVVVFGGTPASCEDGDIPDPDEDGPVVLDLPLTLPIEPGGEQEACFDVEDNDAGLASIFAKVVGASGLFEWDVEGGEESCEGGGAAAAGSVQPKALVQDLSIRVQVPGNLLPGTFCLDIAAQDTLGRTSETARVCLTSPGGPNDPDAVLERLQGNWVRCVPTGVTEPSAEERLEIEGTMQSFERELSLSQDCEDLLGQPTEQEAQIEVGLALITDEGDLANELDVTIELGNDETVTALTIVFVDEEVLVLGEVEDGAEDERPTSLDFENAFERFEPGV